MDFTYHFNKKVRIIIYWVVLALFIIIGRLFYLQIIQMDVFFLRGVKNFLKNEPIAPPRGNILDCNGILLATNRPVTTLYWKGSGNKTISPKQAPIMQQLALLLELPVEKIMEAEKNGSTVIIASDVTFSQLSKIIELFPNNPNIIISNHFKRYYPYQKMASHILGHLSSLNTLEPIGKMGLEKIVHDQLQGKQGKLIKTINSLGVKIKENKITAALAGQNIITTLDINLQQIAESLFPAEYNGAFILMDPESGALKALLSRPNFDPSIFLDPIPVNEWNTLKEKNIFLNRAFYACYPPASIFKLITTSAALEHNIISMHDHLYCPGYFRFKGRYYYCDRRSGHGQLSTKDALAKSCNILFYQIATKMPIDILADYAFRFGLGQKLNIMFPEQEGLVPTTRWKRQEKGEPWWPGETLSCSIGQSYLQATPIQIACIISSIFQGYLVRPRILEHEPVTIKPLNILFATRKFLQKSMKSVVRIGTGREVSHIEDITVFAKTGTAQVTELSKQKSDSYFTLPHAWFVAYFNYKDHKPLTLVILLEHARNTQPAKRLAKNFLMHYRLYMNKREQEF